MYIPIIMHHSYKMLYGSMINVLDACLVNGINIGSISSLTAAGVKVTATFGATHNLKQYQVIKLLVQHSRNLMVSTGF